MGALTRSSGSPGKANGSLRHGHNVTRKAKCREVVEKIGTDAAESRELAQICDFRGAKTDVLKKIECLLKASGDEEIALGRQFPHEELEGSTRLEAGLEVSGGHR